MCRLRAFSSLCESSAFECFASLRRCRFRRERRENTRWSVCICFGSLSAIGDKRTTGIFWGVFIVIIGNASIKFNEDLRRKRAERLHFKRATEYPIVEVSASKYLTDYSSCSTIDRSTFGNYLDTDFEGILALTMKSVQSV